MPPARRKKPKPIQLAPEIAPEVLLYAFRYAFGRKVDAAVPAVSAALIANRDHLPTEMRAGLTREIGAAIADHTAGLFNDAWRWQQVADAFGATTEEKTR